jgi:predicted transcriptional regulator
MKSSNNMKELEQFKREATNILESAKFPIHKLEYNLPELESEDVVNPSKIHGHT